MEIITCSFAFISVQKNPPYINQANKQALQSVSPYIYTQSGTFCIARQMGPPTLLQQDSALKELNTQGKCTASTFQSLYLKLSFRSLLSEGSTVHIKKRKGREAFVSRAL